MSADIRLSRALIVRWLINLLVLTMAASCLSATTAIPSLPAAFEDVRHAAWRAEDGAPANVQGVVQSADGFLWIASATGLYRFDGLTFERIPLEGGNGKQSLQVASVAAAPNGDVWVGYDWGGMAVYHAGHLRPSNPGEPSKASVYLAVTRDGAVWARAPGRRGNRIVRFKGGVWEDIDERWNLPIGTGSIAMLVARDGSLYLLCPDGLRRLRQGARRFDFQPLSLGDGPTLAQDPAGRIWIADADRLARVEMGKGQVGPVTALPHSEMYRRLAFASDGAAWLAGAEDGVRRLSPDASGERFTGGQNLFGGSLGLSSGVTLSIAGDNEDNIWIGTLLGIDRFSMRRFARSVELPLSYAFDGAVLQQAIRRRGSAIKLAIMDNHVVVGVGNIYANEALFHAGIHPARAANGLSGAECARLAAEIKAVLARAIDAGGSTLRDFVDARGKPGYFQQSYMVYGRRDLPCHVCGSLIRELRQGQRSSCFCPHCQPC